jgi:hypothetical protein
MARLLEYELAGVDVLKNVILTTFLYYQLLEMVDSFVRWDCKKKGFIIAFDQTP